MSARIVIVDLLPSGTPGQVNVVVSSEVSDGTQLSADEIIFTLDQTLTGLRDGTITPVEVDRA